MKLLPPSIQRLLAGLALVAAFLVMASVFVPLDTGAEPAPPDAPPPPWSPSPNADREDAEWGVSVNPHEGLKSIGSMEHGRYLVFIYATEGGPRYTIFERATHAELAVLISAERVAELFPALPLPEIDFEAPTQMMLAPSDPRDF